MVKFRLVILSFLISTQWCFSQSYQSIDDVNKACAQLGFTSNADAEIAVDNILDQVGLFKNFTIQECPDINNAVAKNIEMGNGKKERFILYDNEFFKRIDDKAGNDWAAISVLAHEIGHHLNGHALNDVGSTHEFELEADEFSGFVLARMGSSLEDAQSAINTLTYEKATRTHPAKADRLVAIQTGWSRGSGKKIIVKEISEEVKDEIINNNDVIINIARKETDIDKITPEQVLGNYIEAIGGQENIVGIKTMYRNLKSTSTSFADDKETITSSTSSIKYLSPSKFISTTETSAGISMKSLFLDAKFYTQKSSGQWGMSENKNIIDMLNVGSYIPEYLYLVNNKDIKFKGVREFNGKRYYALALPETSTATDMGTSKTVSTTSVTNFYSVETGLLYKTETTTETDIDYTENNEYLKDSKSEYVMSTIHSDYREVGGVLFSFQQDMEFEMEIVGKIYRTETVTKYSNILVNPVVNPKEFTIENKEIFNQDKYLENLLAGSKHFSTGTQLIVKSSCSEGVAEIRKAAEFGFAAAQNLLATLYDNSYYFCKKALDRDYDQAIIWYTKAAEQGEHAALKKLGSIYEKGDYGVKKDKEIAYNYYVKSTRSLIWNMVDPAVYKSIKGLKKSINLNDSELEYVNALQEMSKGDKSASKAHLLRAAEGGNVDAQVALGYVFLMEQKMQERSKWLNKAMEQGDKEAIKLLNQF
jgi:hypothetical protein